MAETNGAASAPENQVSAEELADLRKQVETEKQARAEEARKRVLAESMLQERDATVVKRTSDAVTATDNQIAAQKQAADNAIAAAQAKLAEAKRDFEAAMNEGKWPDAAEAQDAIAAARVELSNGQGWKGQVENYETRWKAERDAYTAQPEKVVDPLAGYSPKAREWIEKRPQFLSDKKYQNRVNAAHFKALSNDYTEFSDDYFAFVEKEIGERKADPDPDPNEDDLTAADPEAAPARAPRSTSTAAAPSRSNPATGRRASESGTLSQSEMAAAKMSFPDEYRKDPKDAYRLYAENKIALQHEGKLH